VPEIFLKTFVSLIVKYLFTFGRHTTETWVFMSRPFEHTSDENSNAGSLIDSHDLKIIDEELLIKKLFEQDPGQACDVLFHKYYRILCSHAVRFVFSKEIAEDIVSEIFCRFWTDRTYAIINTSYRAYLFKAVRFSSYNYVKWELSKKRKEVDYESLPDSIEAIAPAETLLLDELSGEISRIIEHLPPQCKAVFLLSRFENKKYREIAEDLNISIKMVEAHISKALGILRANLKQKHLLSLLAICSFSGL
jgi:RNA polymerase sigma-70 factor (family 1)